MLKELAVRNIAILQEARLEFGPGFYTLTGETGAGKSLLIEAIGLALGEKANAALVRDGAEEATVEAVFDVSENSSTQQWLTDNGLANVDDENELVVSRRVQRDGKSKVFVNGHRSSLSALQKIAPDLIDDTGQHESLRLLAGNEDAPILDDFLPDPKVRSAYTQAYQNTLSVSQALQDLEKRALQKRERQEWIRLQRQELETLPVQTVEEEQQLKEARGRLKNQSLIAEFTDAASAILVDGESSCVTQLLALKREWERKPALAEIFPNVITRLNDLKTQIEDVSYEISKNASKSGGNAFAYSLDAVEEKLFVLERLKRKFGPELSDVLAKAAALKIEDESLQNIDDDIALARRAFDKAFAALKSAGEILSSDRRKAADILQKRLTDELKDLDMPKAVFEVRFESSGSTWESYKPVGPEGVRFYLSPNPGSSPRPLAQIASGGETSRLFLALKTALADHRRPATLIFDEIDTGIGGTTVAAVGQKLRGLAAHGQVFCITHQAQIAAMADHHIFVGKRVEKGNTIAEVSWLDGDTRVHEIARLTGRATVGTSSLEFAKDLLKVGKRDQGKISVQTKPTGAVKKSKLS